MTKIQSFWCQGHLVISWSWPLTYDLEKSWFLRTCPDMHTRHIWLRYCLTRYCPWNLLLEQQWLKHEYRGKYSKSYCHVIADVISIKNVSSGIICDDSFIFDIKMNLEEKFEIFKMATILRSRWAFWPENVPDFEYDFNITNPIPYIWSCLQSSSSNMKGVIAASKFD